MNSSQDSENKTPAADSITNADNETLLIVDDTPTNLRVLVNYLLTLGFSVHVARNGKEALQRVRYAPPDLILMDVRMPEMDGFETCRRLKADETTCDIPVIFMSALVETVDKMKGFEAGAVDYITKPFQREEVAARIYTHLTLKRQAQILERQQQDLMRQKQEIEQKNFELQQQNAELDAFAHTVAHDLKTPVNLIVNSHEFLANIVADRLKHEELAFFQYAAQGARKTVSIINSLLLLASVRRPGEVTMRPLDMAAIIKQVQNDLSYMIQKYCGQISMPASWPSAVGYASWIEEVWMNYISNALKYGGAPPRLELGAVPEENGLVRFYVHDNGPGLSPEEQSRLFVPFTRIGQVRVEGHGLGLSIVHRIIEKCGGSTGVESRPGQGSTFYFTLPAAK
ncbi:MAG: response regulator [Gammaproteobacteria bacterium]|nr:response regulator [Gammaproteobacteria bacterium]